MRTALQAGYRQIPARDYKASAPVSAKATTPVQDVERPHVILSSITWAAIDFQRRDSGLSAAEWITRLVQKAASGKP